MVVKRVTNGEGETEYRMTPKGLTSSVGIIAALLGGSSVFGITQFDRARQQGSQMEKVFNLGQEMVRIVEVLDDLQGTIDDLEEEIGDLKTDVRVLSTNMRWLEARMAGDVGPRLSLPDEEGGDGN
jgi:hypothetical protein